MKIGIVTYWWSNDNYGQLLQCWALQFHLKREGYEPFLIRYAHSYRPTWKRLIRKTVKILLIYPLIKWWRKRGERQLLRKIESKNTARQFEDFRQNYINCSNKDYRYLKQLKANPPEAEVYIVGSDQVWAPVLLRSKENWGFWLDFGSVNTRRIAYAASFGTDCCPSDLKNILRKQLQRFDAISVREESGVDICREAGKEAIHVVDPTLLLRRGDYQSFLEKEPVKSIPYIFIYSINIAKSEEVEYQELQEIAQTRHLSIKVTISSGYIPGCELFENVEYIYATIPQWLSLIKNAELVVTTSFHGIVFCIQFHKPFVYFPLKGKFAKSNSRVINLLEKLALSHCIYQHFGDYERILSTTIDWEYVEKKLVKLRAKSKKFLMENIRYNNGDI